MRVKCSRCGKNLAARQDGKARSHNDQKGSWCEGSYQEVKTIAQPKIKCKCGKTALYEIFINGGRGNLLCLDDALELAEELIKGKGGNGPLIIKPLV